MKPAPVTILALANLLLAMGCASAPKQAPKLAQSPKPTHVSKSRQSALTAHLSNDWIQSATRLQAEDSVIYYRGIEERDSDEDEPWAGIVRGDILLISPHRATFISSGKLTLGKNKSVKIVGLASTFLASPGEKPAWNALLSM